MNTFTYAWKKYLPVIRLLLKRAEAGVQTVKLDSMDFSKGGAKTKPSHSFKIELEKGRIRTISPSAVARDLFDILSEDDIAKVFIRQNKYEISLNSSFELKIEKIEPQQAGVDKEGEEAEPGDKNS
jgi:hypothetical protein